MAGAFGVLVVAALFGLGVLLEILFRTPTDPVHRRGGKLISKAEARKLALQRGHGQFRPSAGFTGLAFGGLKLPLDFFWTGTLFLGAIGSGKTTLFTLLIRDALGLVAMGCGARLVLFDPKREFLRLTLACLSPFSRVIILNPFDKRATRLNLAGTFRTFAQAVQLAAALIPDAKNESQKYFVLAPRAVLTQVFWILMELSTGEWTMRDAIHICRSRKRLIAFLNRTPAGRDTATTYLKARSGKDVAASLMAHLDPYVPVAAASERAAMSVTVSEIMDADCVVVFSLDDRYSEALKPFAALFARALSDEILARNNPQRPTIIGVDELVSWGHLDLAPLTGKGRSAGAAIVATVQEVDALYAVHGETKARALLGTLLVQAHLRVSSDRTGRFSAGEIGEHEVEETDLSYPSGGSQPTLNKRIQNRPLVMADELKSLPGPDWAKGRVTGYFRLADIGTYREDVNVREEPLPPFPNAPEYDRRPHSEETLRPFDKHDLIRLGLPVRPRWLSLFGCKGV